LKKGVILSKEKSNKRLYLLLTTSFVIAWIWAAIDPLYPDDWILENILVVLFVPFVFWSSRYFIFSNTSYSIVTLFLILHVIGSHYTYAEVPFGVTLGEWIGVDRNMYDRLLHLLFGIVFVYPLFDYLQRKVKLQGFLIYFVSFMTISAFAGFYEVLEWVAASVVAPEAGDAFLGTQGDIWDAQKDMALAMVGSLFMLTIISFQNKPKELLG
jgi:putative membrane protein